MKRKRIGSIFMAAVLMAVSLVATPLVAHAGDHKNPETGLPCNNTYVNVSHIGTGTNYALPPHYLLNGESCFRILYEYAHRSRCSSCGAITKDWWYLFCEERHSSCGAVIPAQGH